jgi:hypothetical protein
MPDRSFACRILCLAILAIGCSDDDTIAPTVDAAVADAEIWPDARTECWDPDAGIEDCDYFLGCGCDTPTEKCSPAPSGRECFAAGAKVAGETCVSEDECVAQTTCLPYAGEMRCMSLCDPAHPCAADLTTCYIKVTNGGDPPIEIGRVCGQICSLTAQDCLYDGQGCYQSMTWAPILEKGICLTAGLGTQGNTCARATDCDEGFLCINQAGSTTSVCAKICDRGGNEPSCDEGSCQPLSGEVQTGICLVQS